MRVLLLGGAGDMALSLVRLMREEAQLEAVTLGDLDLAKAQARAEESGPKFSARQVDLTQHTDLVAAMADHDLVINYAGPFYRFEAPAARAAIEAGVSYLSIADDYDAYLQVAELEEAARAAGVKIMSGFGNSPGLTQLLAQKGARAMDRPRKIAVNWAAGSNEAVGPSNLLHLFHLLSGKTLQWRSGQEAYVPCGSGKKWVEFPDPIGRIPVWYTGHAESVTLPRNLPGLEYASVHGGAVPPFDFQLVIFFSKLGITSTHARRVRLLKLVTPFLPLFQSKRYPDKSVGRVEVWGESGGAERYVYYTYAGHIAFITSCPCLQAALWWGKGAFDELPGGVYAPERLLPDPEPFLAELRERGVAMQYHEEEAGA